MAKCVAHNRNLCRQLAGLITLGCHRSLLLAFPTRGVTLPTFSFFRCIHGRQFRQLCRGDFALKR
jgi:hypothetical protein